MSQRESHATSLAAMIAIAAGALIVYGDAGRIEVPAALALLLGSLIGARRGADVLSNASESVLKASFGVFLLVTATLVAFAQ